MQLPTEFIPSLRGVPGFDAEAFIAVHTDSTPVTSLRLNPMKPAKWEQGWNLSQVPWCEEGRYLSQRPSFTLDPLMHAGAYYVQEASSMFIRHILEKLFQPEAKINIVDVCAAPGGKATLLAAYFQQALLVANEVIKSRVPILEENLIKWGTPNTIVTNNDPAQLGRVQGFFDLMLVDAPCSGSGLFRKDPLAVSEWSKEQVALCGRRQERILSDVLPALREGGILIYATCSFSPEEDEDITRWLIDEMDMEAIHLEINAEWGIVNSQFPGCFRFFPDRLQGEGFYIAVLRKKAPVDFFSGREAGLEKVNSLKSQLFSNVFGLESNHHLFQQSGAVRIFPEQHWPALCLLAGCLYIKRAGIELGQEKGKDVVPSHEWAMMWGNKLGWPTLRIGKEEALAYLGRQPLQLSLEKGWSLLNYNECFLGWVKNAGSRLNNYYPSEWRIRLLSGG
jgi:16S rRNA C967 or C1407 C5-methylase (RsmB/RsmF family)/NOL1/NOP2/fmu family ribosome biogenesis protein